MKRKALALLAASFSFAAFPATNADAVVATACVTTSDVPCAIGCLPGTRLMITVWGNSGSVVCGGAAAYPVCNGICQHISLPTTRAGLGFCSVDNGWAICTPFPPI